ncbi:PLD nuclease N-terminal domain-containing protein [Arthrobacter sp. ATA002]|uniref:PLD nuclease N-terminal domain-containing protein n=1 Tax=Arthrobacter sp. ATA002 TaxID=2991715 RepID=UPI003FA45565
MDASCPTGSVMVLNLQSRSMPYFRRIAEALFSPPGRTATPGIVGETHQGTIRESAPLLTGAESRLPIFTGVHISAQSLNPALNPAVLGPAGWTVSIFLALYLALVVSALISISKSAHPTPTVRVLWFLIVLVAPFLGSLLWFILGKKRVPRSPERGR